MIAIAKIFLNEWGVRKRYHVIVILSAICGQVGIMKGSSRRDEVTIE